VLIGITGKARSGKDTIGKILQARLGSEYSIYALASPIKAIINTLAGWDERHADGELKEVVCKTKRFSRQFLEATLQRCADDWVLDYETAYLRWFQVFSPYMTVHDSPFIKDFQLEISPRVAYQLFGTEWGRWLRDSLWLDIAPARGVIITDVRFLNEAHWVASNGGLIIKVVGDRGTTLSAEHISEAGVPTWFLDWVIVNNKDTTLDGLEYLVEDCLENCLTRC